MDHRPKEGPAERRARRLRLVNRERVARLKDNLTPRQRDLIIALPAIFHTTHPAMPGYAGHETPAGIANYDRERNTLAACRRISRGFEFSKRQIRRPAIEAMFIMGSGGTIAHSRDSDLDIWLCHGAHLNREEIEQLQTKARAIETFAEDLELEMHFFVFEASSFLNGENLPLSTESSGSSQRYLLLDEFYRTGLLIAGKEPMWWWQSNDDADALPQTNGLSDPKKLMINFGPLQTVPAEEFFGAAVWQLYKSIESPYKSVLKLMLMEAYASEYPNIELLSSVYKAEIESETENLNALDPYALMLRKVEEYLKRSEDHARLEVLRRCFYIKVGERLSVSARKSESWQRAMMRELVDEWGWDEKIIRHLDEHQQWDFYRAHAERRKIVSALKASYSALSGFARERSHDLHISREDLDRLGRRLYAAFERKPSKVEFITKGICPNPVENDLSIHQVKNAQGATLWAIYQGTAKPGENSSHSALKRSRSLVDAVTWTYANRLHGAATQWHVFANADEANRRDIEIVLQALDNSLGAELSAHDDNHSSGVPRARRALVFVNVGINPFSDTSYGGTSVVTQRTNAFCYGARRVNLVHQLDLVLLNSWGELFCFTYKGQSALGNCLVEFLNWQSEQLQHAIGIEVCCSSNLAGDLLSTRVGNYLNSIARSAARLKGDENFHHFTQLGRKYLHFSRTGGHSNVTIYDNTASVYQTLEELPSERNNVVVLDEHADLSPTLAKIFANHRQGFLRCFIEPRGADAYVYILDGVGRLLTMRQPLHFLQTLALQYQRFLRAVLPRCESSETPQKIEFFAVKTTNSFSFCTGFIHLFASVENQMPWFRQLFV
ncbi:MAG: class I adenylate cyclase [Pseudomonadota bacterium]